MRRCICGTMWPTGPAARAADDGRCGRPAGRRDRGGRDATRRRPKSGGDRSVVLMVATLDGDQTNPASAAPDVRPAQPRRCCMAGPAARVAPVCAAARTVRVPSDEFRVIAASGGADDGWPCALRSSPSARLAARRGGRAPPGVTSSACDGEMLKCPLPTKRPIIQPAARHPARGRHALASPCRTP